MFHKVVIVGVGLIGGSFARALRAADAVRTLVGVGRSAEVMARALELGIIDEVATIEEAMRGADVTWSADTLSAFLQDSSRLVPGNSMAGAAPPMPDARQRRDLVAYLRSGDRRLDLC